MKGRRRVQLPVRVWPDAVEFADQQAAAESERTGVRWTRSKVVRTWFHLGMLAWMKGER